MADVTLVGKSAVTSQGAITPPNYGGASLTLSGFSGSLYVVSGAVLALRVIGKYSFHSTGKPGLPNGAALTLSGYTFSSYGGGQSYLTLGVPTLTAVGTTDVIGRVVVDAPHATFSGSATVDAAGGTRVTLRGHYSLLALGGGYVVGKLPRARVSSGAVTDAIGRVTLRLPRLTITASGTVDNTGSVIGIFPSLIVTPNGRVSAVFPRATMVATGGAVSTQYEAYSVLLLDDSVAVTRYTNYPFEQIVRFGNTYYGVAANGLYELGGDTFDGSLIIADYESMPDDFKAQETKRAYSLYIAGDVGADFTVRVTAADKTTSKYTYKTLDKTGSRNYRVKVGKGIRARYLAYGFTNTNGGDFEIDDMTPEIDVTRRSA